MIGHHSKILYSLIIVKFLDVKKISLFENLEDFATNVSFLE